MLCTSFAGQNNLFGLFLVLASLAGLCECGGCPDGWTEVPRPNVGRRPSPEVECVKLHTEKADWYRAKAICISQESNVLEINSALENDFVFSLTRRTGGKSEMIKCIKWLFFSMRERESARERERDCVSVRERERESKVGKK